MIRVSNETEPCEECGRRGYVVDTEAGEIIRGGQVVAIAPPELRLMTSSDGRGHVLCDDCAGQPKGER